MAGKADMTLYGWKQLIKWSLEHASVNETQREILTREWETHWNTFVEWLKGIKWEKPVDEIGMPEWTCTDSVAAV
jgi:hypothetical protein